MWNGRYLSEHEFINTSTFCICQSGLGGVSSVEAWPASLFLLLLLTISCSGFPQQTKPVGNWSQHTFLVVPFNSLTSFVCKTLGKISLILFSKSPYQIYTMADWCQVPGPRNRRTRRTCAEDQRKLGGPKSWLTKFSSLDS